MMPEKRHFDWGRLPPKNMYFGILFIRQEVWGEMENYIMFNLGKWQIKVGSFYF